MFSDIRNGKGRGRKAFYFFMLDNHRSLFITGCHHLFYGFKSRLRHHKDFKGLANIC